MSSMARNENDAGSRSASKSPIAEAKRKARRTTIPKPFRFQTEERSILKRNLNSVKVKDGDLMRKRKEVIKTTPTLTQPFRFRTEERSIFRAANDEHFGKLKDRKLVVEHQHLCTRKEKLSTRVAKLGNMVDFPVDDSVLNVVDVAAVTALPTENSVPETRGNPSCLEVLDEQELIELGDMLDLSEDQDHSVLNLVLPYENSVPETRGNLSCLEVQEEQELNEDQASFSDDIDVVAITVLPSGNSVPWTSGNPSCLEVQEEQELIEVVKEIEGETYGKAEMAIAKKLEPVDAVNILLQKPLEETSDVDAGIGDRQKILYRGYDVTNAVLVEKLNDHRSRDTELQTQTDMQLLDATKRHIIKDSETKDLLEKMKALEWQICISEEQASETATISEQQKAEIEEALRKVEECEGHMKELQEMLGQSATENASLAEANVKPIEDLLDVECRISDLQKLLNRVLIEKEAKKELEEFTRKFASHSQNFQTQELLLLLFKKMALLGWGLARGLLCAADVGLAFHLNRRKVLHLEKWVLELSDDKEELRSLYTKAVQEAEHLKERFYVSEVQKAEYVLLTEEISKDLWLLESDKLELHKDVEKLEKRIQDYGEKLSVAEKHAEEYEGLNKTASKDIKHLKTEKEDLEFSLERALQTLQRREEELVASNAQNRKLEDSMVDAMAKVKEEQHAFAAYRIEAEMSMATALKHVGEKERECEDLALQKDKMQRDIALLLDQKMQNVKETETLNRIVETFGDENMRLQKQVEDLKLQLECHLKAMEVPTAASQGEISPDSRNGCFRRILDASSLQNHSQLPSIQASAATSIGEIAQVSQHGGCHLQHALHEMDERSLPGSEKSNMANEKAAGSMGPLSQSVGNATFETNRCRRRLGPERIASLKDLVTSCSRQGSVNLKQRRSGKEVVSKEEAEHKGGDDHKPSSMNHEVGMAPSGTSNHRPRLGRDQITILNNLVSSCSRRPAPFQRREVKARSNPRSPEE